MRYQDLFPPIHWLAKSNRSTLRADAFAGFTGAAIVLPQGVAFAAIAGLPPEYGLYTAMITAVVAALFGSSMIMISGPTTAISAILFATISDFARPLSAEFIELALMMTVLVGLFQIAAGAARLGGLVALVSHSVMTAFTAAAAVLIAVSQLAGALELHVEQGGNVLERLMQLFEHAPETNTLAMIIGASTLASALVLQRIAPKLPVFLIALVVGSGVGYWLDAANNGVSMIGALPDIVPSFHQPQTSFSDIAMLAPGAAAIALVGLLEAISISRAFALRRNEDFDANQEMLGQGVSNVVGGFFQCYAGSGSFTRSGVNALAGAVTPMSGIFASFFLLLILFFVAPLVAHIPTPAMSSLILLVAWNLIDFGELSHIFKSRSTDAVIVILTFTAGILIELDFAIYVGVIASLCVFVYASAYPALTVTAPSSPKEGGLRKFREMTDAKTQKCPQLMILALNGPLFFGSVDHVGSRIKKLRKENPKQVHMVLILTGVGKLDLAGADLLKATALDLQANGGSFGIVATYPPLIEALRRFGVNDVIGADGVSVSKGVAISRATARLDKKICKVCLKDVFGECDSLRDA
ncbi:SulP family inorganic anion transporter [Alphaproteobacteria bacterium KMM 3653]|uniref:SulP family inorganic anion transporter n=1 Tax=Harenicola maris TaxID=2841044 RepID=A0AAP2G6T8_9RHOB|nr:SulP family inorganic anion transporter [Harenicola maris]